ncbi:MAG: hypothetical protein ACI4RU_05325, partial [Acutalibacteraceae bacterium]
ICVALRIYHVLALVEPQTGFYSEKNFTVPLFYAVLIFACAFIAVGAYLSKDIIDVSAETVNGKGSVGVVLLFLAAGFFLDFGYCFLMLNASDEATTYSNNSIIQESAFSSMMRTGSLPRKAEMVFAFLAFLYFLIFAVMILTKKYKGQMKIFSLVTVFWGISRLVTFFVKQISFIKVSDLFLEIATTAFITLFFFSFCESLSGVYKKDAQWRVFGLGLPASLCCLTVQIPRIVAAFIDSFHAEEAEYTPILYSDDYIINYAVIFTGVLVIAIFADLRKNTVAQKTEE